MEADLSNREEQRAVYERLSKRAVENLTRRGILAQYAATGKEALAAVMEMVPEGVQVGTADSTTLLQIGIFPALKKRGRNEILNPFLRDESGHYRIDAEGRYEVMRKVFLCDVYLIGTNAVTLDGKLVNIDGYGNRVAAMIFGPRKVVVVAGANKIVKDVEEAIKRIHNFCAPRNVIRHGTKHQNPRFLEIPCSQTGYCVNCLHPMKICNYTTIIEGVRESEKGRIHVVLIGEDLGM